MNTRQDPITDELTALLDELATVLDDLALATRDAKADLRQLLHQLRHSAAHRLYDLADKLTATEER